MKTPKTPQHPTTEADWRAWLSQDLQFAEDRLKKFGEVRPLFVMHTRDDTVVCISTGWADERERGAVLGTVALLCLAHDVKALSFISEAWLRMSPRRIGEGQAEYEARMNAVAPRNADDRIEIVSCMLAWTDADYERHGMGAMRGIERDAAGRAIGCAPIPGFDDKMQSKGELEGDIVNLLPDFPTDPEQRAMVGDLLKAMGVVAEPLYPRS